MSRVRSDEPLLPSLLDRLIDDEPDVTTEPAWQQSQDLREYQLAVLRDVENLLNSRPTRTELADGLPEVAQSVLTYGMPDFTSIGISGLDDRERLRRAVQRTVQRFEPRLRNVRAILHEPENRFERSLRLTVEAMLHVDPEPVAISFDTLVQPAAGTCKVETS